MELGMLQGFLFYPHRLWSDLKVWVKRGKHTKERKEKVTVKWSSVKVVPCPLQTGPDSLAEVAPSLRHCHQALWGCSRQYIQCTVVRAFTSRKLPQSSIQRSIMFDMKNHWHGQFSISWSKMEFYTLLLAEGMKTNGGCNNKYFCKLKVKGFYENRAQSNIYSTQNDKDTGPAKDLF